MMRQTRVITVDGPAGAGKSTVSRLLAERIRFVYLDTGAIYRALALRVAEEDIRTEDFNDWEVLCRDLDIRFRCRPGGYQVLLGARDVSEAIRRPGMDLLASQVSAVPAVREALRGMQQRFAAETDVVAEGRDMGTMVFPAADCKFFLTAAPDVRAGRRYAELQARGEPIARRHVAADMRRRDRQDQDRPVAPLMAAQDAISIDSSSLGVAGVLDVMLEVLEKRGIWRPGSK